MGGGGLFLMGMWYNLLCSYMFYFKMSHFERITTSVRNIYLVLSPPTKEATTHEYCKLTFVYL